MANGANREILLGKRDQRGSISGAVLALTLSSAVFKGSRLIPVYPYHKTVVTVMQKMSQENGLALLGDAKIRESMVIRLKINDIRKFGVNENLEIILGVHGVELLLDYEGRIDLFANLALIAAVENKVLLRD
jgi:hypothetical protein